MNYLGAISFEITGVKVNINVPVASLLIYVGIALFVVVLIIVIHRMRRPKVSDFAGHYPTDGIMVNGKLRGAPTAKQYVPPPTIPIQQDSSTPPKPGDSIQPTENQDN